MKFTLCVFITLFIVAGGMPIEPNTAVSEAESLIHSAEMNLDTMTSDENKELSEMAEIQNTITSLPDHIAGHEASEQAEVLSATQLMLAKEKTAVGQETEQQSAAMAALSQVTNAIATLKLVSPKGQGGEGTQQPSLGEQQSSSADGVPPGVEHALNKLEQVSASLAQGTKTSNTMHRIERMKDETHQLAQEVDGSIGDLAHSPKDDAGIDESALAALSHMHGDAALPRKETNELKHILEQEKKVEMSEKQGLAEISALTNKLG